MEEEMEEKMENEGGNGKWRRKWKIEEEVKNEEGLGRWKRKIRMVTLCIFKASKNHKLDHMVWS